MKVIDAWCEIPPGTVVNFRGTHDVGGLPQGPIGRAVKLAEQWDRYTGVNQYSVVVLAPHDEAGKIIHISHFLFMDEKYTDQFDTDPKHDDRDATPEEESRFLLKMMERKKP